MQRIRYLLLLESVTILNTSLNERLHHQEPITPGFSRPASRCTRPRPPLRGREGPRGRGGGCRRQWNVLASPILTKKEGEVAVSWQRLPLKILTGKEGEVAASWQRLP